MQAQNNQNHSNGHKNGGFTTYFLKHLVMAIIAIGVVLWALASVVDYFDQPGSVNDRWNDAHSDAAQSQPKNASKDSLLASSEADAAAAHQTADAGRGDESANTPSIQSGEDRAPQPNHGQKTNVAPPAAKNGHAAGGQAKNVAPAPSIPAQQSQSHQPPTLAHGEPAPVSADTLPVGVAFVAAVIQPIKYELEERFWGWRPNDIINLTDNINQFQLGTLEVTRRTVVQLTERISRTGYNDAIDRNLENAMNFLMVKADSYWFPSPESKYKESIAELGIYKQKLMAGKANFYTRPDNLIPLFSAYEDLLGSCDENLVKSKEADGSKVDFTTADDYFYYAKGVANAMATILEAVQTDFATTLAGRHGNELLHHAIISCRLAASLEPWIVTNGALDGILANHRAHMAAPISHARYYMGQLIKTLST